MLTCKRCRGRQEFLLEAGVRAWICPRCEWVSVQITDWNVWKRVHRAVMGDRLDRPIYKHVPTKTYVLRRSPCPVPGTADEQSHSSGEDSSHGGADTASEPPSA